MLALPFGHDIWVIGGLLVVLSVLATFESPTVQACIPQMLSGYDLMRGNAVVSQIQAIAGLITSFLGSLVYATFGLTPVLWGTVVCFFLTAVLERFIRLNFQKVEGTQTVRKIIREDFAVSLRFLSREQPDSLKLLLLAALASLFVTGTGVVGFPYLVRTLLGSRQSITARRRASWAWPPCWAASLWPLPRRNSVCAGWPLSFWGLG